MSANPQHGERRVEYMPLDDITPADLNPKRHDLDAIRRSIGRFGFTTPALLDERTGKLVAGHGRSLALLEMRGAGETPPVGVQMVDGVWLVPVLRGWSSRSDAEAQAYLVADNRLTEVGGWDTHGLADLLSQVSAADAQLLEVTGFSSADLEQLLAAAEPSDDDRREPGLNDPDDAPEEPEDPVSRLGDVWLLGPHRLVCGDSTKPDTIVRLMGTDRADLVFTDPPYGMSFGSGQRPGSPRSRVKMGVIQGDDLRGEALIALVRDAFVAAAGLRKPESPAYVCFTWRTHAEFAEALRQADLVPKSCIVWDKGSIGLGTLHYRPQHEFIFYVQGAWYGDKAQSDVWTLKREVLANYVHSTQKPVELVEKALRNSSKPGDYVLDLFGGSGSTLIACYRTRRIARLVELDPKYVDVICRRWQEHTGNLPVLEATGEPHDFTAGGGE